MEFFPTSDEQAKMILQPFRERSVNPRSGHSPFMQTSHILIVRHTIQGLKSVRKSAKLPND